MQDNLSRPLNWLCLALAISPLFAAALATNHTPSPTPQVPFSSPAGPPITEAELRALFTVSHVAAFSQAVTHEKMEVQRKKLPEWYPQAVWDEIERAIDGIDLPMLALPIYKRYMTQEDIRFLTKFLSTPLGQQMALAFLEANIRAQRAGADPTQAHEQALRYLAREDRSEVERLTGRLSPAEQSDVIAHAARFQALAPIRRQIQAEYERAVLDKQTELVHSITLAREQELFEAKKQFASGSITGNVYTNPFFGFTFAIPKNWWIVDIETVRRGMESNASALANEYPAVRNALDEGVEPSWPELAAIDQDPGSPDLQHHEIKILISDITGAPTRISAVQYLRLLAVEKVLVLVGDPEEITINGKGLGRARMKVALNGTVSYILFFVLFEKQFVVTFVFTSPDEAGLVELEPLMQSIRFSAASRETN